MSQDLEEVSKILLTTDWASGGSLWNMLTATTKDFLRLLILKFGKTN